MRLLKDQNLSNKNVVVRLDLNVPIQDKQIIDSTRIISSLPTIKYLVNKNCKVLLTSHLGRPEEGKFDQNFSMSLVAEKLSEILNHEIDLIDSLDSSDIFNTTQIQLLENLRFYPGEEKNDITDDESFSEEEARDTKKQKMGDSPDSPVLPMHMD